MARIIAAAVGGILIGILAMLAATRFGASISPSQQEIVRDIMDVPKMELAEAEKHRDEQYTSLASVSDVMALPTEFSRSEALYAIAGRSDTVGTQKLIFGASRIADDVARLEALKILFFRLAEIDPQSALAIARTDQFKEAKTIEQIVWRAWARKDFDDAMFAAKTQPSLADRTSAAQSLFAAFGYMGNTTTERIEAELGTSPDHSIRRLYLYQLADRSPAEAIDFINDLEPGRQQQEYISWLAYYVSSNGPTAALTYADFFTHDANAKQYSNILNSIVARQNPRATIERLMAGGFNRLTAGELHSAMNELASTDLDAAKQYYEQARTPDIKQQFGSIIVASLAKSDPAEALQWARANEKDRYPYLQMSVLRTIAQTDPQLAFTEALNISNPQMRSSLVSNVLQQIAQNDPATAVAFLDQIQNRQHKIEASHNLASSWIQRDADAAIDWILNQDEKTAQQLIQQTAANLLHRDIDAAIRLLPRIDEQNQAMLRRQIAQKIAINRSPSEAQTFIQQFDGEPGYAQLQASLISGMAVTDAPAAKLLADQLTDSNARDSAYVQVIGQRAQTEPLEAARWLDNLADERLRGAAAGRLATQWYANDPVAAEHWVSNLPVGSVRDDAIMNMSSQWGTPNENQVELIASIKNRDKRGQAKIRQIYNVIRTNPQRARQLLDDEDIPEHQRQQVEMMILQYGSRF